MDSTEAPKVVRARKPKTPKGGPVAGDAPEPPVEPPPAPAIADPVVAAAPAGDPEPEVAEPAEVLVEPARPPRKPRGPYKPRVKREAVAANPVAAAAPMALGPSFWAALHHTLLAQQKTAKSSRYASMPIA